MATPISTAPARRRPRPRRRASVTSVLGELLVTIGVVTLLFVVWQIWIGDRIIAAQKASEAQALAEQWAAVEPVGTAPGEAAAPGEPVDPADIPVRGTPAPREQFGVMYVPRFGEDWRFTLAEGVERKAILDAGEIGHYVDSAMPGGVGNAAFAAHRWTSGAAFDPIDQLVVGDAIVIETMDGWYTYRFRTLEYVQDTAIEVLLPVPQQPGVAGEGRYLTLTSCAPKFNMLERIIAYAVFDEFTPRGAGAPASLTDPVAGMTQLAAGA